MKCYSFRYVRMVTLNELAAAYDRFLPPIMQSLSSAPEMHEPARSSAPAPTTGLTGAVGLSRSYGAEEAMAGRPALLHETLAGPPRFLSESTAREISRPPPPSPAPRTSTPPPAPPARDVTDRSLSRAAPTSIDVDRQRDDGVDTRWLHRLYLQGKVSNRFRDDQTRWIRDTLRSRAADLREDPGTDTSKREAEGLEVLSHDYPAMELMREAWIEEEGGRR